MIKKTTKPPTDTNLHPSSIEKEFDLTDKEVNDFAFTNFMYISLKSLKFFSKKYIGLLGLSFFAIFFGIIKFTEEVWFLPDEPDKYSCYVFFASITAFLLYLLLSNINPKFNDLLSNASNYSHLQEYISKAPIHPEQVCTPYILKRAFTTSFKITKTKISAFTRKAIATILNMFLEVLSIAVHFSKTKKAKVIGLQTALWKKIYPHYVKDDSEDTKVDIQNTLDNAGQSAELYELVKDDDKLVEYIYCRAKSLEGVSSMLENSLGPDARFLLKNFNDYAKCYESFTELDLMLLEESTRKSFIQGVYVEFATRLVRLLCIGVIKKSGGVTKAEAKSIKEGFKLFSAFKGKAANNRDLINLSGYANDLVDLLGDDYENRPKGVKVICRAINEKLNDSGIEEIKFKELNHDDKFNEAVTRVAELYLGKKLSKNFIKMHIKAVFEKIEKTIAMTAYKDYRMADRAKLSKEVVKHLSSLYGIDLNDTITVEEMAKIVTERIKVRSILFLKSNAAK
jgi:hypothetical protein